jgi:hypothetical protein
MRFCEDLKIVADPIYLHKFMEVAILIISVISAAGSIIAVIFAYEAWRNPQPDLEFVLESAKITKAHSRRYFLKVEATVINSSSVDAILDDVKINNVSLKGKGKETVSGCDKISIAT